MQTKKFKFYFGVVYVESFDGVSDFVSTINSRKEGTLWEGHIHSHTISEFYDKFTLTQSYSEADKLLAAGYTHGAKALKSELAKLPKQTVSMVSRVSSITYKPQGSSPSVGRYLSGNPNCMRKRKRVQKTAKSAVVKIYFSSSYAGGINSKRILEYGAYLINIIRGLECQGYRVEIINIDISNGRLEKIVCTTTTLKKATETLNLAKISYPLVHPSWERRHMFRWQETCPECNDNAFVSGYGCAVYYKHEQCKKILPKILGKNDLYVDFQMYCDAKANNKNLLQVMKDYAGQLVFMV